MTHYRPSSRTAVLAALLCSVATAATANDRGPARGILPELPANAPPGDCYAHVKVRGAPQGPPPVSYGAQWVQTPGPPGAPGPIWCLVPTGPHPVAAPPVITQEGWIRVVCERDMTTDRVRDLQHRLQRRGVYRGEVSGAYDRDTAAAVGEFQRRAQIDHGGYLSLDTWEALNGPDDQFYGPPADPRDRFADRSQPPLPPAAPREPGWAGAGQAQGYSYRAQGGDAQRYYSHESYARSYGAGFDGYAGQAYGYPDPYAAGAYAQYGGYYQQSPGVAPQNYGWRPPYAAVGAGSAVQNGYLVWSGKTRF